MNERHLLVDGAIRKEIELIKAQSALLLQKNNRGFSGELKTSGAMIENYVRGVLAKHLPHGYRICSGYILTTKPKDPEDNLQQHDLIIADRRIPSIYEFGIGDIEIVPAEAVCGIIEVKRTLTKSVVSKAIEHLRKTKNILDGHRGGVKSKIKAGDRSLFIDPRKSNAPIYAVIGLSIDECPSDEVVEQCYSKDIIEFIDLIWAIDSPWFAHYANGEEEMGSTLPHHLYRNSDNLFDYFGNLKMSENCSSRSFGMAISLLRNWISQTTGALSRPDIDMQYFGVFDTYGPNA